MTVFVLETAPERVRGELTRWFLEVKPGVFVGKVNVRIRDLLWERIASSSESKGAVCIYSAPNEQGFEMKMHGDPRRRVTNFEGVQLITVVPEEGENHPKDDLPDFPFEIDFLEEAERES